MNSSRAMAIVGTDVPRRRLSRPLGLCSALVLSLLLGASASCSRATTECRRACGTGQVCHQGTCRSLCDNTTDCWLGESCSTGVCLPTCNSETDCVLPPGCGVTATECIAGICIFHSLVSVGDGDCPDGGADPPDGGNPFDGDGPPDSSNPADGGDLGSPGTGDTIAQGDSFTFDWNSDSYGACSADCGPGTQSRLVWCERNDSTIVADALCDAVSRPDSTQDCNDDWCSWSTGGWGSCSEPCDGGTETRDVDCRDNGTDVPNSYCNSDTRPSSSRSCNTQSCCTEPSCGGWSMQSCCNCSTNKRCETRHCTNCEGGQYTESRNCITDCPCCG